ncbi:uncharacterized protein PV07_11971 [Cladophialophora immunda]|uniref:CHAT domain-containing protein n=1 Tax=Cladophialophora immunda TaxID=569365 RepID=A0A0D2BXE3_9EURO|nr:uncharacterized protein PV07_11971 [Cladophialophora immunda]KIW23798.1 hypothetical protein PV07_11971 [Cladophialophora immunda]
MQTLTITALQSTGTSSWRVAVSREVSFQYDATERDVHDPFTSEQERECQWYLEEYATRSPFEEGRARRFSQSIEEYAQDLFRQLDLRSVLSLHHSPADRQPEHLTIEIATLANPNPTLINQAAFHRLHWELLETPELWDSFFSKVTVVRKVPPDHTLTPEASSHTPPRSSNLPDKQTYNVLLVVARDLREHDNDALPDSVLNAHLRMQPILETLTDRPPLRVEVVRPGTFAALEQHLRHATQLHGPGYFDVVHFDMHGIVKMVAQGSQKKLSPKSFLKFAHPDLSGRLQLVSASRVAELLNDHQIDRVVLTACKTATSGDGMDANLAKTFVSKGMSDVLGMSFEFLSSATTTFAETFYRSICADLTSFAEASSEARGALRADAQREARFGIMVLVVDWYVPVTYASTVDRRSSYPVCVSSQSNIRTPASGIATKPTPDAALLVGREFDVLRLEAKLATNAIVAMGGRSGTGKSRLLRHLSYVWEATRFADRVLYVDAKFASGNGQTLLSMVINKLLWSGVSLPLSESDDRILSENWEFFERTALDERTSTILVLDNLDDALRLVEACDASNINETILPDLQKLFSIARRAPNTLSSRKSLTILVSSRWIASRWCNLFEIELPYFLLGGLRLASALNLAQKILGPPVRETPSLMAERVDALEDIVNLLDRLPGPLFVVLRQFHKMEMPLAEYYNALLCGRLDRRLKLGSETEQFEVGGSTFLSMLTPVLEPRLMSNWFSIPEPVALRTFYSLSVFWNEGPEWHRYTDLLVQTGILEGIEPASPTHEKDFLEKTGNIIWHLKDLDGLDYEGSSITWIHPLLTLSLRNMIQDADPACHYHLQDALGPSIWKGLFAELLHGMLQRWKAKNAGHTSFAGLAQSSKSGRQNLALCIEACLHTPLRTNEWPLQYFSSWVSLYRYTMTSREQSDFLASLSRALRKVVKFVDSDDSPELRNWHLIWTILHWIYEIVRPNISWDGNQKQDEFATRHIAIAKAVFARSKAYCANLEPIQKAIARIYRLEAVILLSHLQIDDAQKAWASQNDIEDNLYGICKDEDFHRLDPGQLNTKPWAQALLHLRRFLWHRMVSMLTEPENNARDVPREFFGRLIDTTSKDWGDMLPVVERMGYLPPDMSSQTAVNLFMSGQSSTPGKQLDRLEAYLRDGNTEKALSTCQLLLQPAYENGDWGQIIKLTTMMLDSSRDLMSIPEKWYQLHSIAAISSFHLGNHRHASINFAKAVHIHPSDSVIGEAENFLNGDPLALLKTGLGSVPPSGYARISIAVALYLWLRCDAESAKVTLNLLSPFLRATADTIQELFTDILQLRSTMSQWPFLDLQVIETARMFEEIESIVFCRDEGTGWKNPLQRNWVYFEDSIWPLYYAWEASNGQEAGKIHLGQGKSK